MKSKYKYKLKYKYKHKLNTLVFYDYDYFKSFSNFAKNNPCYEVISETKAKIWAFTTFISKSILEYIDSDMQPI